MAGLAVSPESPVWLRWIGRFEDARAAEQRLLGSRWELEGDSLLGPTADRPEDQVTDRKEARLAPCRLSFGRMIRQAVSQHEWLVTTTCFAGRWSCCTFWCLLGMPHQMQASHVMLAGW